MSPSPETSAMDQKLGYFLNNNSSADIAFGSDCAAFFQIQIKDAGRLQDMTGRQETPVVERLCPDTVTCNSRRAYLFQQSARHSKTRRLIESNQIGPFLRQSFRKINFRGRSQTGDGCFTSNALASPWSFRVGENGHASLEWPIHDISEWMKTVATNVKDNGVHLGEMIWPNASQGRICP
jgi:hypothetical protein